MLAPLIVFVYDRLDHVKDTLTALENNYLSNRTQLYIFSDGPKDNNIDAVRSVREYLQTFKEKTIFMDVTIKEAEKNKGLAKSIIEGVTDVIQNYGRVIVVEDDVVTTKDFLNFMNDSLDYYEHDNNIWEIGGYNLIGKPSNGDDVFICQRTCSCAWATWKDRWNKVDWEVKTYRDFKNDIRLRREFNMYGNDRAVMLDECMKGLINSWAIRFSYAEFLNKSFTVLPSDSKASNTGYDGSGTHCDSSDGRFNVNMLEREYILKHLDQPSEETKIKYQRFYDHSKKHLLIRWLKMKMGIKTHFKSILKKKLGITG